MHRLQTPCFIVDRQNLHDSINGFRKALNANIGSSIIGYSIKTNSLPYCLLEANRLGCYAEAVSYDEYALALACGFEKNRIIYNGPMKSKETFIDAVLNGATVNIETKREIEWLESLPAGKTYAVGIRLNINLSKVSPEDADGPNDCSRFGFSDESREFEEAVCRIRSIDNVRLNGLHIHRTTHSRSVSFYERSINYAIDTMQKYGLSLDFLDIGGGYFGIFGNKPSYADYCEAIARTLDRRNMSHLKIIVEPGNGITASPFSFLSEVIDVKQSGDNARIVTTDGSRNDIDPLFRKSDYIKEILYADNAKRQTVGIQTIVGCTCLEFDRIFALNDAPELKVGDRILYRNVGAYTCCLSPLFIRYFPRVYVYDNGHYLPVRDEWTEKEYLNLSYI